MSGHTAEEINKHIKIYMIVFAALAGLTIITVGISYLDLAMHLAVILALTVACIKGTLVATYFMHLISERGLVFWVLGFTIFFFAVCLSIPVLNEQSVAT